MTTGMTLRQAPPLIAAVFLAACALSPQVVTLHPKLEAVQLSSAPASVALEVADARHDAIVGYRGGVYATASISTAADMPAAVRGALVDALAARGFRIVELGQGADISLKVEIAELGYVARQDNVKRVIETSATVRATSTSGTITRTGEYRDRRTKEVLSPPGEQGNADLINAVLSGALQRLIADPELLKY